MKTTFTICGLHAAQVAVGALLRESVSFEAEPLPFDDYAVMVNDEDGRNVKEIIEQSIHLDGCEGGLLTE